MKSECFFSNRVLLACGIVFLAFSLFACSEKSLGITDIYEKLEVFIPMRDGIRLYTEIYIPNDTSNALPIILARSPYGISDPDGGYSTWIVKVCKDLAEERFIFAFQDARGRFKSEGKFVWNRPMRDKSDPHGIDASTDAYDTIDWLVKNVANNNERVGMLGISYPGWYTTMALIDSHPALKAASPQASPSDYFIGDDFFHHGAFRLSPSVELPYLFDHDPKQNSLFPYDQVDTYEFFLDLGPLSNMNERYLHGSSQIWNDFLAHSTYDEFWKKGNTLQHLKVVPVPTLNVIGWWDAENLGGALDIYDKLESVDEEDQSWIVVGPWHHGQWDEVEAKHLGNYDFGSETRDYYQENIQTPFFNYYLKDKGRLDLPEATMFQTGSNEWKTYDKWPPVNITTEKNLYFHSKGHLSFEPPQDDSKEAFDSYVSDPDNPVPYTKRPVMGFWQGWGRFLQGAGRLWKVEDQRFVHLRPDVLSWETDPLEEDLEVAGRIKAFLHASTTGTDSDWIVKLIDVYPEDYPEKPEMGGYQLMIADDVLRGKFREGFEKPKPITPNKVTEFMIHLYSRNHCFRKGHKIMVQVQSTWFPLIDRNPQTFVDIPTAKSEDYQKATQRIYYSKSFASHIKIPVVSTAKER